MSTTARIRAERLEYTALSDRMGNLQLLRFAMGTVVVAWAALRPESVGVEFATLWLGTVAYLVGSSLAEVARRRTDRFAHAILNGMLLVDGLYLAFAMPLRLQSL